MSWNLATKFETNFFLVTICPFVNNQIFCIIYHCEGSHRQKYICITKSMTLIISPISHSFFGLFIITESYFDSCDDIWNSRDRGDIKTVWAHEFSNVSRLKHSPRFSLNYKRSQFPKLSVKGTFCRCRQIRKSITSELSIF